MTSQPINGAQPQPAVINIPQECSPQRIPVSWIVQSNPDLHEVAFTIFDATGQRVVFQDPDDAQRLGEALVHYATSARSGLVIP